MAKKASKSAKQKTGPAFAAMPGGTVSPVEGPATYKVWSPNAGKNEVSAGRWLVPGEPVTVHGFHLPGGMIYFGAPVPALDGHGIEPALLDPSLRIADPRNISSDKSAYYYPDYRLFDPLERRAYLRWLANGRSDPDADFTQVYLFFYGLERRIIAPYVLTARRSPNVEPPLLDQERQALREEIVRLGKLYPHPSFQRCVGALLAFLDLTRLLTAPEKAAQANPRAVAAQPSSGDEIPTLLAVVLARLAFDKQPLTADWAWVWFCKDSESRVRASAVRCAEEMRCLFALRFAAAVGPRGMALRLTKAPIPTSYRPIGPGYSQSVLAISRSGADHLGWLYQVNRTPLKAIREIADACMDDLDLYSRRIARDPDKRNTLPVVALLPEPLFAEHPAAIRFRADLDEMVRAAPGAAVAVPVATLLARWQNAATPTPLSRADTMTLLDAADRLGFAIEPDLRYGGAALAVGKEGNAVAAIARRSDGAARASSASASLLAVGLPLLVRAARASGGIDSPAFRQVIGGLPHAVGGDQAAIAARVAWLVASPKESARLPKPKEPELAALTSEERAQIADVLASAASLSGAVAPAAVAELIRLFALLGLPDSDVFTRLHSYASTSGCPRGAISSGDDTLSTVQTGKPGKAYGIPQSPPKATKKATGGVAIDLALVRQKEAESAQISGLLAEIFTDDASLAVKQSASPTPAIPPTAGGLLDARHASLLRALIAKDAWAKSEVAALARAEKLLPNAAIETINEAAFERFDEPILEGDDTIYVSIDLARELI